MCQISLIVTSITRIEAPIFQLLWTKEKDQSVDLPSFRVSRSFSRIQCRVCRDISENIAKQNHGEPGKTKSGSSVILASQHAYLNTYVPPRDRLLPGVWIIESSDNIFVLAATRL